MLRHSATQQWQCQSLLEVRHSGRSGARTDMLPTLPSFVLGWVERWTSICAASFTPLHIQAANAGIKSAEYKDYAASQINYMLGDNPNNFSYVVGYGDSFPKQPHHKVPNQNNILIMKVRGFWNITSSHPRQLHVPLFPPSARGQPSVTQARITHTS